MSYIGNEPSTTAFLTNTFNGTGSQLAFTMSLAPANTNSLLVTVSGVIQDPSTYSVSGTTLTFSGPPPSGTGNISVRYLGIPASGVTNTAYRTLTEFTATSGQTSFTVPSYTVGYIDVYRNGVRLAASDYTASTGTTVVLANGCTTGDIVVTESFYVSSVLNAIPATAGAVNTSYISDNAITTAKIAAGAVVQADLASGVAGNGPAFSAYPSANATISAATYTKVILNTEDFDTANAFDSTSTYRFTPQVAGYYQVNLVATMNQTASLNTNCLIALYKNGSYYKGGGNAFNAGTSSNSSWSGIVSLNGSTDYIEMYVYTSSNTATLQANYTNFSACLVRSA